MAAYQSRGQENWRTRCVGVLRTPTDTEIRESEEEATARIADSMNGKSTGESDFSPEFVDYVQEDIDRWFEQSTRGKRHIRLKSLFTEPSFQRQGMGNALVKYGNHLADQASLPIFL